MRDIRCELLACLILIAVQTSLHAQSPGSIPASVATSSSSQDSHSVELERKLEAISSALAVTHQQLEQSQQEMEQLREELAQIKKLLAATQSGAGESSSSGSALDAAKATAATIEDLQEQ
jgi:septal ring factor EnvC (AmiA/AmiB activator)